MLFALAAEAIKARPVRALGTPVYYSTNGIVWRISEVGIGGNAIPVLGAGGRFYDYAVMTRPRINPDDQEHRRACRKVPTLQPVQQPVEQA
jgi:hypothetical protein